MRIKLLQKTMKEIKSEENCMLYALFKHECHMTIRIV